LITAGICALASIATFGLLRERAVPQVESARQQGMVASLARLLHTWRAARRCEDFA
jgi:UMF1 family MFS transporter